MLVDEFVAQGAVLGLRQGLGERQDGGGFGFALFVPVIQHGNQDAARLQQGKRGLERGDAGFGLGGDVVVAARQVAHVENGGGDGLFDVSGEMLVPRVDKLHALDELVLL